MKTVIIVTGQAVEIFICVERIHREGFSKLLQRGHIG